MSRTKHLTMQDNPHRQRAQVRLTKRRNNSTWYFPYSAFRRPKNAGGSHRPGGGYAKDRAEHAAVKKHGRRRERRRRNAQDPMMH